MNSVIAIRSCSISGAYAIQTHDHRFFADVYPYHSLTEITHTVRDTLGRDVGESLNMDISGRTVAIWSAYRICTIRLEVNDKTDRITGLTSAYCNLQHRINLIRCGINLIIIRTDDNVIYSLDYRLSKSHDGQIRMGPINIPNSQDVCDIIQASICLLFVMSDGSVQKCIVMYDRIDDETTYTNLSTLRFPEGVCIAKVVFGRIHTFFITTEGNCYYSKWVGQNDCEPILIESLLGCVVTDIFVTSHGAIMLHDANQLCFLETKYLPVPSNTAKVSTAIPVVICAPRLDLDESIKAVIGSNIHTYIVTDWGRVHCNSRIYEPNTVPIQFFDNNPIMIEALSFLIKSARSCITEL